MNKQPNAKITFVPLSITDALFAAFTALCTGSALFGCFLSLLGTEGLDSAFFHMCFFPAAFFTIICCFIHIDKRTRTLGIPLLLSFTCMLAAFRRQELTDSAIAVAGLVTESINQYYGANTLPDNIKDINILSDLCLKGLTMWFLFFLFFICLAVCRRCHGRIFLGILASLMLYGLCIGKMASAIWVFIAVAAILSIFSMEHYIQRNKKFSMQRKTPSAQVSDGKSMAAALTICLFLFSTGIGCLFTKIWGDHFLSYHDPIKEWANNMEYSLLHFDIKNALSNLPFSTKKEFTMLDNHSIQYTGKEVLVVTLDKQPDEPLYLRGFTGGDYKNGQWQQLNNENVINAISPTLKNLPKGGSVWEKFGNKRDLSDQGILCALAELSADRFAGQQDGFSNIEIQYIDKSKYAYIPYYTKVETKDSFEADGAMLRRNNSKHHHSDGLSDITVQSYTNLQYNQSPAHLSYLSDLFLDDSFHDLECCYRDYVKNTYTQFPENCNNIRELCSDYNNTGMRIVTDFISQYLSGFTYTLSPSKLPLNADYAEYFLFESKQGYCVHFATAATLMYRACGQPARFVEGYVAWPDDFKEIKLENDKILYEARLTDRRAHAWTEIYVDGFGFYPVDMTPDAGDSWWNATTQAANTHKTEQELEENINHMKETPPEPSNENNKDMIQESQKPVEKKENQNSEQKDLTVTDGNGKSNSSGNSPNDKAQSASDYTAMWFVLFVALVFIIIYLIHVFLRIFIQRMLARRLCKKRLFALYGKKPPKSFINPCETVCLTAIIGQEYTRACKEVIRMEKNTELLSSREWKQSMLCEKAFLQSKDYKRFSEITERAMYAPDEQKPNQIEADFCMQFLSFMRQYISAAILEKNKNYVQVLDQMIGYKL